jgi:DNA polymerase-3 subunit gamma/tau
MSALYQRARPITFAGVVGQSHVVEVLTTAIRRDRVGHAYLFSGPRGVGKTTSARLLAMAVNCERELEARPCGACESCQLVQSGSHPDVTELDAASNNSVEDVRDMREKVRLASLRGGVRVWILDEAHMLSRAAANALLKTLEEPPPGLIFVLATTEPEKLPPTVLSRCQHFRFRRLAEPEIEGKLARLCSEAGVEAEPEALALVARSADGAMRDAESLLDRLFASGEAITLTACEAALGLPPQSQVEAMATALCAADLAELHRLATDLYRAGFAPRTLLERLAVTLRDALFTEVTGADGFTVALERGTLLRLIHTLDDEQERFVRRNDLYQLEVALIKGVSALAAPASGDSVVTVTVADAGAPASAAPPAAAAPPASAAPAFEPNPRQARPDPPPRQAATRAPEEASEQAAPFSWRKVKGAAGVQLKAFLMPAREGVEGRQVTLSYGDTHRFHYSELSKRLEELTALIERVAGPGYELVVEGPEGTTRKKA